MIAIQPIKQEGEIWKPAKGLEDRFLVSNYGNVWSIRKGKPAKLSNHNLGYLQMGYNEGLKTKVFKVHRLIAQTFIPNPDNLPDVNHKDLDKKNNRVENLEWMSRKDNMRHARTNDAWKTKLNANQVKKIRQALKRGQTQVSIAAKFGVSQTHISCIKRGLVWDRSDWRDS